MNFLGKGLFLKRLHVNMKKQGEEGRQDGAETSPACACFPQGFSPL
ncbi:hypothetical protein STRDD11_01967 [Streptococcus sp. DD11]|nr:hypothetical protein [Streptococcus sp. DD11]KXT81804.1 hypothetical protein STRDD11_01967 [Streptococcus sp. DD11]